MSTLSNEQASDFLGGWEQLFDSDTFTKWGYRKRSGDLSPYRVIVDLDETRGHFRVVYTSRYGGSHLVKGNLGKNGRLKAILLAQQWMHENRYGCPPPSEYDSRD